MLLLVGVRSVAWLDEGEWKVALEGVRDADDAGFADGGVGEDGLFDGAYILLA